MKRKLYNQVIKEKKIIEKNDTFKSKVVDEYKLNNSNDVVVINDNTLNRTIKLISYKLEGVIRMIGWILLMVGLSVGATVLINEELREVFINIFK